jgi:hypothetical protein
MAQMAKGNQMARWRAAVLAMVAVLPGCVHQSDVADAQHAVWVFHHELDEGDYDAIWNSTGEAMRKVTAEGQFKTFLGAVHTKLGTVGASQTAGWRVNYTTGGQFKLLDQQTDFAHGKGQESFVFQVKDQGLELVGYHINSMQLVTS